MKRLAHVDPDSKSEIISIWEAAARRVEEPDDWEGRTYYDIVRLRPMSARTEGDREISFCYKPGHGPGHGLGSKGIAHELVQEHMCHLRNWHVTILEREIDLSFEKIEDEVEFIDPKTKKKIYVDCVGTLSPDSPFLPVFGNEIAIEVVDQHKLSLTKQRTLKRLGVTTFQFDVFKEWHIKTVDEPRKTVHDISRLRSRIDGALKKSTRLEFVFCRNSVVAAFNSMGIQKKEKPVKASPPVQAAPVPVAPAIACIVAPVPAPPAIACIVAPVPAPPAAVELPPAPVAPVPPRVIQANVASRPARQMAQGKNPGGPAIVAIVFVVLGLLAAWITANSHSTDWPDSLHTAFWILIGSSFLSAIFASISLSIKLTWYGMLLTILCVLYAGAFSLFAISLGFH